MPEYDCMCQDSGLVTRKTLVRVATERLLPGIGVSSVHLGHDLSSLDQNNSGTLVGGVGPGRMCR